MKLLIGRSFVFLGRNTKTSFVLRHWLWTMSGIKVAPLMGIPWMDTKFSFYYYYYLKSEMPFFNVIYSLIICTCFCSLKNAATLSQVYQKIFNNFFLYRSNLIWRNLTLLHLANSTFDYATTSVFFRISSLIVNLLII